ncbi:MAG: hypothetical protein CMD68_02300 [Gammaproteobacteria bacterium]|nr:hypothetical protein [Gammaproteobacteria bacterium]
MMNFKDWNTSILAIVLISIFGIFFYSFMDPTNASAYLSSAYEFLAIKFENIFQYGAIILIIFLILFALSKKGSTQLQIQGRDEYSLFSWGVMIFTAGMGASILYWSPIEWAHYYNEPPFNLDDSLDQKVLFARSYSNFHWGLTGWAIYTIPALAFAVKLNKDFNINLTFSGILVGNPKSIFDKFVGSLLDFIYIVSIISGAAIAIGVSFPLIALLTSNIFNYDISSSAELAILMICFLIVGMSTILGLSKGIKRLSLVNIFLVFLLLASFLFLGPTGDIFSLSIESIAILSKNFFKMSTYTGSEFVQNWTVFYWAWWLALSPFVGSFVVNISNGKTLREIIFGTMVIGSLGSMFHFLIIGNYSYLMFSENIVNVPQMIESGNSNLAILMIIQTLPYEKFFLGIYSFVMLIFLCTTYDSCAYVLSSSAMKSMKKNPDIILRLIFSALLMVLPGLFLFVDGIEFTKNILLISSIPILFIFLAMMYVSVKDS